MSPTGKHGLATTVALKCGPNDPRIGLIMVEAQRVEYMIVNKPKPVVLFELVKGMITGDRLDIGQERGLNKRELNSDAAREAR